MNNKATDSTFTSRISNWSATHRWWVVSAAVLVLLLAAVVGATVETKLLDSDGAEGDAALGSDILDRAFTAGEEPAEQLVFQHPTLEVDSAEFRTVVETAAARLRALPAVGEVTNYYESGDTSLVSTDQHVLRVPVEAHGPVEPLVNTVEEISAASDGFIVSIAGRATLEFEDERILDEDFAMVLIISLGAGLAILLVAFRSLIAAAIPLAMALGAIFTTMAIAAAASHVYPLNELYAEMVLLMGLAVGIDYSLFMVSRFRRERAAGYEKYAAISIASRTTGRAVFYAGLTVVLSISGLMLTDNPIFISLSLGAIIVVAIAIIGSLTLLPALLALVGDGVDGLRIPLPGSSSANDGRAWAFVTERVLRRPGSVVVFPRALRDHCLPGWERDPGSRSHSLRP